MVLIFCLIYLEGGLVFLALHDSLYELDVIEDGNTDCARQI